MSDPTDRLNLALSGRYRIERQLGEGGMATVYLAEDLRHARKVAIKVLKPELAAVVGSERFLTEIRTTANLQHPHILPLFDSGEADGFLWYVMPYVEGESLRDRLDREKHLPVAEAVATATKVAGALQAAHDQGVVHRDVKPANVLLDARGEPLVADFGIALAVSQAGGGRLTETGLSLGTPYYMSPEQATADRDPEARSDVYALGCVLYEMLVGDPPHTASTAQAVVAKILTETPPAPSDRRPTVPAHVDAAVLRALEKVPADRFRSARAFAEALGDPGFRHEHRAETTAPAGPRGDERRGLSRWVVTAAAAIAALFLGLAIGRGVTEPPGSSSWRFTLADRLPIAESGIAVGPRGELAYRAGGPQEHVPWGLGIPLVVRTPKSTGTVVLEGTEHAADGVFSPDGRWFAFRQTGLALWDEPVLKIPTGGGTPVTVWEPSPEEPWIFWPWAWSESDLIYGHFFDPGFGSNIGRLPASGGDIQTLFELRGEDALNLIERSLQIVHVELLPGERKLLFDLGTIRGTEGHRILSLDLASGDTAMVVEGWGPQWSPSGHLVFARGEALQAAPFDPETAELTGDPVPLGIDFEAPTRWPRTFDVSRAGAMAVLSGLPDWSEPDGAVLVSSEGETPLPLRNVLGSVRISLSPDGGFVAYLVERTTLIQDLRTGSVVEISGTALAGSAWSPDGSRIAIGHHTENVLLIARPVDEGPPRRVEMDDGVLDPTGWLPDGRIVAERRRSGEEGDVDLVLADPSDGSVEPLLDGEWWERQGRVSPDGRWLAYESWVAGEREIYARSFPELGPQVRISRGERVAETLREFRAGPFWSADGGALYHLEDGLVWRTELDTTGGTLQVVGRDTIGAVHPFDELVGVHPDGRVLLYRLSPDQGDAATPPRLTVITDMVGELRRMEWNIP